jgi:peptide deformylase
MTQPIVQKENPVLREKTKEVPLSEITSSKFKDILRRMKEALDSQDDGVAIAAPQIGEPWRIFVVSGKVFDILKRKEEEESENEEESIEDHKHAKTHSDVAFINPKIVKLSRDKAWVD